MKDWPEMQALGHKGPSDAAAAANGVSDAARGVGTATSTLEQLMNGTGGQGVGDEDDGAPGAFADDFVGKSEVREPALSVRFLWSCGPCRWVVVRSEVEIFWCFTSRLDGLRPENRVLPRTVTNGEYVVILGSMT